LFLCSNKPTGFLGRFNEAKPLGLTRAIT